MAGIVAIKAAFVDLKALAETGAEVAKGGLTAGDVFSLPKLYSQCNQLFLDLKAAKDNGEIQDLDADEVRQLLGDLIDLGAFIAGLIQAAA